MKVFNIIVTNVFICLLEILRSTEISGTDIQILEQWHIKVLGVE